MARVGSLVVAYAVASATAVAAQPAHKHRQDAATADDDDARAALKPATRKASATSKSKAQAVREDDVNDDDDDDKPTKSVKPARHRTDDDDGDAEDDAAARPIVVKRSPLERRSHNEFYFRAGLAYVDPQIKTGGLQLVPTPLAQLAANPMSLQGGITSNNAAIFAANLGFAPAILGGHVAFETVVGIPSATHFQATGPLATQSLAPTALGGIPTGIPALGSDLGQATATPLMLTAIARLPLGPVTLYAGGGPSVLFITNTKITNPVLNEVATPQFSVTPVAGVIAQAGIDVHIWGRIYARVDVKELWFQTAEATISNIQVHTTIPLLETVDVGSVKSQFTANPIIYQAGLGASF